VKCTLKKIVFIIFDQYHFTYLHAFYFWIVSGFPNGFPVWTGRYPIALRHTKRNSTHFMLSLKKKKKIHKGWSVNNKGAKNKVCWTKLKVICCVTMRSAEALRGLHTDGFLWLCTLSYQHRRAHTHTHSHGSLSLPLTHTWMELCEWNKCCIMQWFIIYVFTI